MKPSDSTGQVPEHIGIFGSNGHIGIEIARQISIQSPQTKLRLLVRSLAYQPALQAEFPNAEVVLADYYDLPSLEVGLKNLQGLFIVTPDFLNEEQAMNNLVAAVQVHGSLQHIVRLLADPPGMTIDRVPKALKDFGNGTATQHLNAKVILKDSGLPITYINVASYFFQNLLRAMAPSIREERKLVVPRDRRMGFIDSADIASCAAALLLTDGVRHIGNTYHLDNGHDVMWFEELADLMTEAFGETITYEGSDEYFLEKNKEMLAQFMGHPDAADYFLEYMQFEQDNEQIWSRTGIVPFLTGRPAKKLADWLHENKQAILQG